MDFPHVSMRLQGMEMTLSAMMMEGVDEIKDLMAKEIKRTCSVENVKQVIKENAEYMLRDLVRKKLAEFYENEGKAIVVREILKAQAPKEKKS